MWEEGREKVVAFFGDILINDDEEEGSKEEQEGSKEDEDVEVEDEKNGIISSSPMKVRLLELLQRSFLL